MTTTAMEHADDGANNPARPIVLTLGCATAQGYLKSENLLLQATFGFSPIRVDVTLKDTELERYIFPNVDEHRFQLMKKKDTMSYQGVGVWIESAAFLAEGREKLIAATFSRCFDLSIDVDEFTRSVRPIIVAASLLKDSKLEGIMEGTFPNATIFVAKDDRSIPEPLYPPVCTTCGTRMRQAGKAYVCEGCGSAAV